MRAVSRNRTRNDATNKRAILAQREQSRWSCPILSHERQAVVDWSAYRTLVQASNVKRFTTCDVERHHTCHKMTRTASLVVVDAKPTRLGTCLYLRSRRHR